MYYDRNFQTNQAERKVSDWINKGAEREAEQIAKDFSESKRKRNNEIYNYINRFIDFYEGQYDNLVNEINRLNQHIEYLEDTLIEKDILKYPFRDR